MKKKRMMAAGFLLIFAGLILTSLACNSTPAATTPATSTANCSVKYGLQTPQPTMGPMSAGFLMSQFIDVPLSVTAKSVNIYTDAGGASDFARVAIYSDNAGVPGTKLVESGSVAVSPSSWNSITIPDTALTAGSYWIAFIFQTGQMVTYKGTGGFFYYNSSVTYGTLPTTFPSGTGSVGKLAVYLSVCQ